MPKIFCGMLSFFVFVLPGLAQSDAFQEPETVKNMLDHYIRLNKEQKEVEGWRIQLITTTDRRQMDHAIYKFKVKYPGEPIVWKHISPYYHVKVGAYQTKLELQGFLIELKKEFPSAIATREKIEKTDLL